MRIPKAFEFLLAILLIGFGIINVKSSSFLAFLSILVGLAYFGFLNRGFYFRNQAESAFRRKDMDKCFYWLARAWKTRSMNVVTLAGYIYLLLKYDNLDKAEQVLDEALTGAWKLGKLADRDRNLLEVYRSLSYWKRGSLDQAVQILEVLRNQGYKTTVLYETLGFMLLEQGNLAFAEEVILESVDYDENDKVILDNLGSLYLRQEKWEEAGKIYAKLLSLEPAFPEAWYNAGTVELARGKPDQAQSYWKKALNCEFNGMSTISRETVNQAISQLASPPEQGV